jgi:hypothetical protein
MRRNSATTTRLTDLRMSIAMIVFVTTVFAMPVANAEPPPVKPNATARGDIDANIGGQPKPANRPTTKPANRPTTKPTKPGDRKPIPHGLRNPFDHGYQTIPSSTDDDLIDPFDDRGRRGSAQRLVTQQGSPIETSLDDDGSSGPPGGGASGGGGSTGSGSTGSGGSTSGGSTGVGSSSDGSSGSTGSGSIGGGSSGGSSSGGGSTGSGSTGSGSTGSGSTGSGSTGSGSTGSGSTGSGSTGSGSTGSGSTGSGSTGSGSTGSGSTGSGSPTIIQLPTDVAAPEVNASAFPTAVRLGGRFTLIVTATFGAGVEVNLKEPFDLGPAFEVRRRVSEDRPRGDGKTTREWQIDVLVWELGDLRLSGITVTYTVNGAVGQIDTNAVRLRVDGVLGDQVDDPKALRDLQPPTELITDDYFWLLIGGGVVWTVAVVCLYLWLRGRRKKRIVLLTGGVVARPRKMDMTSEKALAALLAIETSGVLADREQRREGYAKMVEVIREYLGARYRVATLDLTSSELVRKLGGIAPDEERMLVEEWLETCDLVKYGGLRTTTDEAQVVLDDARALVVTTSQPRRTSGPMDKRTQAAA